MTLMQARDFQDLLETLTSAPTQAMGKDRATRNAKPRAKVKYQIANPSSSVGFHGRPCLSLPWQIKADLDC